MSALRLPPGRDVRIWRDAAAFCLDRRQTIRLTGVGYEFIQLRLRVLGAGHSVAVAT